MQQKGVQNHPHWFMGGQRSTLTEADSDEIGKNTGKLVNSAPSQPAVRDHRTN